MNISRDKAKKPVAKRTPTTNKPAISRGIASGIKPKAKPSIGTRAGKR